ncbi:MAG: InlB B-repeat-containing protein [Bacteroidales bacterium]|nr:InlB B-repeat-containing protein [Bacteroidales bacterium]
MKIKRITAISAALLFSVAAVAQDWTSVSLSGNATDGYYINMPQTGTNELTLTAESPTTFKVYDDGGESGRASINCSGYLSITVPTGKIIHLSGFVTIGDCCKSLEYMKIHNGQDADEGSWDDYKYGNEDSGGESVEFVSNGNVVTLFFRTDDYDSQYYFSNIDLTVLVEPVTNLNLGSINGLLLGYEYNNGNAISVEYTVADATGKTLTKDVDYTAAITNINGSEVTSVTDEGEYTLTISGIGEYTGTLTSTFFVGSIDLSKFTENFTASDGDELTGTTSYTVYIADGATVTLNNATITGGIVCNGSATIILAGENNVNASQADEHDLAGIRIGGENTTLIIKGEGSLTVEGKGEGAGIGTIYYSEGGSIEIQSGTINATSSDGAGIGSGNSGSVQNITISGGTITATSNYGAGIGTGISYTTSYCGDITIRGGTIVATGGWGAPGIGAAESAECGNISITGGTITAIGGEQSSGLGSGDTYYNHAANCGDITITEGITRLTVTRGADCENAIGAGIGSSCGTITIGGVETGAISVETFVTFPYTVAYDANGGTGTMESTTMMAGLTKQLTECSFTRTDYVFAGWNTESQGSGTAYADKAEVKDLTTTAGATVTLYAQWKHLITGSDVVIAPIADQTYTGSPIEPEVSVTVGKGGSMSLNEDYTVAYSNNINVGAATVTVTGIGFYTGEITTTFTIKKATPTFVEIESQVIDNTQTLADVSLPAGYSFVNAEQTLEVGENTVALIYNPDADNYEDASGYMTVIVTGTTVTDVQDVQNVKSQNVKKYLENGTLIIEVNGVKYDVTGRVVK